MPTDGVGASSAGYGVSSVGDALRNRGGTGSTVVARHVTRTPDPFSFGSGGGDHSGMSSSTMCIGGSGEVGLSSSTDQNRTRMAVRRRAALRGKKKKPVKLALPGGGTGRVVSARSGASFSAQMAPEGSSVEDGDDGTAGATNDGSEDSSGVSSSDRYSGKGRRGFGARVGSTGDRNDRLSSVSNGRIHDGGTMGGAGVDAGAKGDDGSLGAGDRNADGDPLLVSSAASLPASEGPGAAEPGNPQVNRGAIFDSDVQFDQYYERGQALGRGAFAVVYSCSLVSNPDEVYAVKVMKTDDRVKATLANREVSILADLPHEHVITLYEVYASSTHTWMVMEYLEGGRLDPCGKEPMSEDVARGYAAQLLKSVEFMHHRGVAHRDLKPDNMLLSNEDVLKIIDFGLSVKMGHDGFSQTFAGTGLYMAPEVLSGKSYDKECDMWSVGVIIFAMLSGHVPFYSRSQSELKSLIMNCTYEFGPEWDSISSHAKDLVERCLRVIPSERYTAREALSHPWITGDEKNAPIDTVLELVRQFAVQARWRTAACTVRAAMRFTRFRRDGPLASLLPQSNGDGGDMMAFSGGAEGMGGTAALRALPKEDLIEDGTVEGGVRERYKWLSQLPVRKLSLRRKSSVILNPPIQARRRPAGLFGYVAPPPRKRRMSATRK